MHILEKIGQIIKEKQQITLQTYIFYVPFVKGCNSTSLTKQPVSVMIAVYIRQLCDDELSFVRDMQSLFLRD